MVHWSFHCLPLDKDRETKRKRETKILEETIEIHYGEDPELKCWKVKGAPNKDKEHILLPTASNIPEVNSLS